MAVDKLAAEAIAEQLARLREDYLTRLPAELAALSSLARGLSEGASDRDRLDELHHRLHKLAGSGGTFGFAALGARARAGAAGQAVAGGAAWMRWMQRRGSRSPRRWTRLARA